MGELKALITGYAMVILFSMAGFIFMIQFLSLNNPDSAILNNKYINDTSEAFQSSAKKIQDVGESAKGILETDSSPQKALLFPFLIIFAGFSVVINFLGFLTEGLVLIPLTLFTLIFGAGGSPGDSGTGSFIIFAVINGLLLVGIVLAVLKGMRTGDTG